MKIDPFDKVQALKHSRKYAEDYKKYEEESEQTKELDAIVGTKIDYQLRLSEAGKKLCKKYNLRFPINPNTPAEEWEIEYIHTPISFLPHQKLWKEHRAFTWTDLPEETQLITHVNGKLVLLIDTDYPKSQILKELEQFLDHYAEEPPERIRKDPDIWQVYRMHKQEGKRLLQITRELHELTENPTYNKITDSRYRQVKRAYQKADRIIKAIENPTP